MPAHLGGGGREGDRQRQPRLVVCGLVAPVRLAVDLVGEEPELEEGGPDRVEEGRKVPMVRNHGGR